MTEVKIREYRPGDPILPIMRDYDFFSDGPVIIGKVEDEYVFIAGIRIFWKGMGEAWLHFFTEPRKYPGAFFALKESLQKHIDGSKLWRVEANAYSPEACKLIEHLGFKFCCIRKYFGPDNLHSALYERVTEWQK